MIDSTLKSEPHGTDQFLENVQDRVQDQDILSQMEEDEKGQDLHTYTDGLRKSRLDTLSIGQTVWLFRRMILYMFCAYSLTLLDMFQIGVAGSIIANKGFIKKFGTQHGAGVLALDTSWVSAWGAIINVGQIVSILYISYVANRFGRKWAFFLCWLAFVCCLFCLTFAQTPGVWLLGKLFVGLAAGSQQATVGNYLMEIVPNRIRGGIIIFSQAWTTFGVIMCNVMLLIANRKYPDDYLLPVWVCWGLSGLMIVCIIALPESPWFYCRRGRKQDAVKSLLRLNTGVNGYNVEEEVEIIMRTLVHERAVAEHDGVSQWRDVFTGINLRRTILVTMCWSGGQWAGNAMIGTYSTYFFSIAGLNDPFLGSLITSVVGLGTIMVWGLLCDKVGRRIVYCSCYSGVVLILWIMGALYYAGTSAKVTGTVVLVLICFYQAFFTVTGQTYMLQQAEFPSARLRIKTATVSLFVQAIWGIVTSFMSPPLLVALNIRAGFVFGSTALPFLAYFWYYLPETKGRAASEIDELFERKVPAWKWSGTETEIEAQMKHMVTKEGIPGRAKADP